MQHRLPAAVGSTPFRLLHASYPLVRTPSVHFSLRTRSCLVAASVVALMTETFKSLCGRLRPDFLDRCQPQLNSNEDYFTPRFGATATNITCSNTDPAEVCSPPSA